MLIHVVEGSRVDAEQGALSDSLLTTRRAAAGPTLPPAVEVGAADDVDGVDGVEVGVGLNHRRFRPGVSGGCGFRPGVSGWCGFREALGRGGGRPGVSGCGVRPRGDGSGPRPGISGDSRPRIPGGSPRPRVCRELCPRVLFHFGPEVVLSGGVKLLKPLSGGGRCEVTYQSREEKDDLREDFHDARFVHRAGSEAWKIRLVCICEMKSIVSERKGTEQQQQQQ